MMTPVPSEVDRPSDAGWTAVVPRGRPRASAEAVDQRPRTGGRARPGFAQRAPRRGNVLLSSAGDQPTGPPRVSAAEKLSGDGFPRQAKMFRDVTEDRGDCAHAKRIVPRDRDVVLALLLSGQSHMAPSLPRDHIAQCRQGASKIIP